MNLLTEYPKARKILYLVQWVLNGIFAVLGAYFAATQTAVENLPEWYVIPLAIAPVLWTYLGLQAGANTPSNVVPPPYEGQHVRTEGGYGALGGVGVVLAVVAAVLALLTILKVFVVSWVAIILVLAIGLVLIFFDGHRGRGRVR